MFMISEFIWLLTIPTLPARKEEKAKSKKEVIVGTIYVLHSSSVRLWYAGMRHDLSVQMSCGGIRLRCC